MAGYLRGLARSHKRPLPHPRDLVIGAIGRGPLLEWCSRERSIVSIDRLTYYDARPTSDTSESLEAYWEAIELLPDTDLGFGSLRGRPRRQKGVDTLIAVDMLSGAFNRVFDVAILVAGDADFVPVVQEVRRLGLKVGLISESTSTAIELRRAVDRSQPIDSITDDNVFPPFHRPGIGFWYAD